MFYFKMPKRTNIRLKLRPTMQEFQVFVVSAKSHNVFDAGPVVPAAIKQNDFAFAGRWATYRWKYDCVVSRSVGVPRATTLQIRGLRLSAILLIEPPLPAASRPSKITTTFNPLCRTHS